MAQDPVSAVAAWLTPARADVTDKPPPTSAAVDDPILAMIAEVKRLEAQWIAVDEIRFKQGEGIGKSREANVLDERMGTILNQLRNTKPVTLAGAIAMLDLGRQGGCDDERLINAAIASLRDMQPEASREAGETADPVIDLGCEMAGIEEAICHLGDEADDQERVDELAARISEIETEIAKLVASSLEGILWQARILKSLGDYNLEIDARPRRCHNALIANIIAGLKRLSASGGVVTAATSPAPGDSKILALFREWVSAQRHMSGVPGEADEEFKAACAVINGIEDTINETPSSGAAGLAIKNYLSLHIESYRVADDQAALGKAINYEVHASILKDAVRFVPELAPLAAHALAAHRNASRFTHRH